MSALLMSKNLVTVLRNKTLSDGISCVSHCLRFKHKVDRSKVPILHEMDLEEQYVRGSGPGGQSVNKTSNCVVLKHVPSGVVVKCHETRSLEQNRKLARCALVTKLDNLINKENSIEAQIQFIQNKKSKEKEKRQIKLKKLKAVWKEREGLT